LKGILSEHPEQALMFIKNSFQTTALTWILSLGKKFKLSEFEEKPHYVLIKSHPDGGLGLDVSGDGHT
jgi:hypothetical protein